MLIQTLDRFLGELLSALPGENRVEYSISVHLRTLEEVVRDWGQKVGQDGGGLPAGLTVKEIYAEMESFVYPRGLSRQAYVEEAYPRRGRRHPLQRSARAELWQVKEAWEARMSREGRLSPGFARQIILSVLEEGEDAWPEEWTGWDGSLFFVDEVQDVGTADLRILKQLSGTAVIMAGDDGQSLYGHRNSFREAGVQIQGGTQTLETNYRSTRPLMELGRRFRLAGEAASKEAGSKEGASEESSFKKSEVTAFREGPPPSLVQRENTSELYTALTQRLQFLTDTAGYEPGNIYVLAPTRQFFRKLTEAVEKAGLAAEELKSSGFDFSREDKVRLSTLPSAKGLDMPVVLLFLPRLFNPHADLEPEEAEEILGQQVYVSITRAMDYLEIYGKKEPPREGEGVIRRLYAAWNALQEGEGRRGGEAL